MAEPGGLAHDSLVLHTLRCIGFAVEDRIAAASGLTSSHVEATLESLSGRGLVSGQEGVFGGWGLTEQGRRLDDEWLASELAATGTRIMAEEAFATFSTLNPRLLRVCHDWQLRGVSGAEFPNDHSDPAYDSRVIDRLVEIDESVRPLLMGLSVHLARFATYQPRLTGAVERVVNGDRSYFTDGVESYHTVWFQLHEDLLSTLGLERNG